MPRTASRATILAWSFTLALPLASCRQSPPPAPPGPAVVLCAGDSITAASYPDHLQRGLNAAGIRAMVVNAGVKGHTSGEYLGHLLRSRVVELANPRWVLLQLGTNDVRIDGDHTPTQRFRENLDAILDLVSSHRNPDGSSPRVLLATIPPVRVEIPGYFDAASRARVEAEINPAIRDIALRRGLPLVDNHALFAIRPELLPEIHPSEEGYRALADSWQRTLAPLLVPGGHSGAPAR